MVLVQLIGRINSVQHNCQAVFTASRNCKGNSRLISQMRPASVGLHIVLGNHVKAINIAEFVDPFGILVVAGPDGIDVVALHDENILKSILIRYYSTIIAGKLVPVYALEHNALPVYQHQAVLHLEAPEAHILSDDLSHFSLSILHL